MNDTPSPGVEPMIDRWARNLDERRAIEGFIEWCRDQSVELSEDDYRGWSRAVNVGDLLDRFHEIDRRRLENERRAMLDETRARAAAV